MTAETAEGSAEPGNERPGVSASAGPSGKIPETHLIRATLATGGFDYSRPLRSARASSFRTGKSTTVAFRSAKEGGLGGAKGDRGVLSRSERRHSGSVCEL